MSAKVVQENNKNNELFDINQKISDVNKKISDIEKKISNADENVNKYLKQQGVFNKEEADAPGSINRRAYQQNQINLENALIELGNLKNQLSTFQQDKKDLENKRREIEKSFTIDPSNRSVFETLTDNQINRILAAPIGTNVEGVNVTERLKWELKQYLLEKNKESEESKLNSD